MNDFSTQKKKRGRPPKLAKTIDGNRLKEWASQIKRYTKPCQQPDETTANLANSDNLNEIIREFGGVIPESLIRELYSTDESETSKIDSLNFEIERRLKKSFLGKMNGTKATKDKAGERACEIWSKNHDLIEEIQNKKIFKTDAARKILKDWGKRGHGEKPSSIESSNIRLITGWYGQYIQIVGKRLVHN
jgi:hypothetical protein